MRFLANYGWDDHYYRAVGSLFDPNYLGLMMILTFLLINNKSKFRYKRLLEVLVVFVFALTYSRSSFVTLIGMTAVVAFSKRNIKALIVSVLLVGGLVVVLPSFGGAGTNLFRTASISQRVDSQRQAIEVWKERPILGVGFNAYPAYVLQKYRYDFMPRHASAPDNSYLFVLATTGVIGMAAFLYFIWQLFASLKSNKLLIGSLVAVGIHALFNNSLFYPWVMVWILTLVAEEAVKTRVGI
jgi:O-antigen ligase